MLNDGIIGSGVIMSYRVIDVGIAQRDGSFCPEWMKRSALQTLAQE